LISNPFTTVNPLPALSADFPPHAATSISSDANTQADAVLPLPVLPVSGIHTKLFIVVPLSLV
jgi:hypothetical protein